MTHCEADVRVGGAWRYVLKKDTGEEVAFSGTYAEVTPPTRLVYTQVYEPIPTAGETMVTVTFDEHDGKTHLVSRYLYPSKAVRDGVIASGFERNLQETMDLLEALLS